MKRLPIVLAALSVVASCVSPPKTSHIAELEELDAILAISDEYVRVKEQKIATIEGLLQAGDMPLRQQYVIYGQLYDEYVAFQFDRANEILDCQIAIAEELDDLSLSNSARIHKAHLLTSAGMFLEASNVFAGLDTLTFDYHQKVDWYDARQKFLHDYQEYVKSSGIFIKDADKKKYYQDQILENTTEDSPLNRHIRVLRLIEEEKFDEAYRENLKIIGVLNPGTREYAVQTYWQGYICENLYREKEVLQWWIRSAICDVKAAIKDNAALCSVAIKLTHPDDTDRAFRYVRISLDDAIFYNAKLRKVQIAGTLPWIEKAYRGGKEELIADRSRYLVIISLVAILLLLICCWTVKIYLKQKKTALEIESKNIQLGEAMESIVSVEDSLRKTNLDLMEANAAKEEYLGLFLSMCSRYLDKLKKHISREDYEAELKKFYKIFDTSFLSLYPTFVEDFNSLLKEDCRITLKDGELLNTELRVFALIRLGITQSSHIASLLRYSVNTIYNYRAQVKNSALSDRENFESMVCKIGARR